MKCKFVSIVAITLGIIVAVYASIRQTHEFSDGECAICHVDEINDPKSLLPYITDGCESCHANVKGTQSHPTDIYPSLPVPADMPLTDGKLTCITCHYVHPKENQRFAKRHYFLRRYVTGPVLCIACHTTDNKGHIVLENVHLGSYRVTDASTRIDAMSLICIECHDRYINEPSDFMGTGQWKHMNRLSHPIGVSYGKASSRKLHEYQPSSILPDEVPLFNGKIGCGTCHSIYSKRRSMLVMDNKDSRLCMQCHVK